MKILITGSSGLVGSAILEVCKKKNIEVLGTTSKELDLKDQVKTAEIIQKYKPTVIVAAAAKVGGINVNYSQPYDFLNENLQIQISLMEAAIKYRIPKLVFLGSSCIYPRLAEQPIKEEFLMTGYLESTNSPYAIAKIAGIEAVKAARQQFNLDWISLMPTNVYGPNDNFNVFSGHVLPSIIHKMIIAKEEGFKSVELWGDGTPLREFIYSEDLANAILVAIESYNDASHLNIGTGQEISVNKLANVIAEVVGFNGEISWRTDMPNGTPRKILDSSKIFSLGWKPKWDLKSGIAKTVEWFNQNKSLGKVRI